MDELKTSVFRQMQFMVNTLGVKPSWENFTLTESWGKIVDNFDEKFQTMYRLTWNSVYKDHEREIVNLFIG